MSKRTDILKLRVTPEFKARVLREAAYRQVSLTELTETALENEMRLASTLASAGLKAPVISKSDDWTVTSEWSGRITTAASDPVAPPATIDPSAFSAQPVGAPDSTFSGQKVQTPVPVANTALAGGSVGGTPQPDAVSTSGEVGAKAVPKSNCTQDHPLWQFCQRCYEARVTR